MPIFSQFPLINKNGISPAEIEQYKEFIHQLKKIHYGILSYAENEDINHGKKILKKASDELEINLKIQRKYHKKEIHFQTINKRDWKKIERNRRSKGKRGKILLIDIDSKIPNIALGKLSTFWKREGYYVEYERIGLKGYPGKKRKIDINAKDFDKVFVSNIFTVNQDYFEVKDCEVVEIGGVGSIDPQKKLPEEVHQLPVDYDIYRDDYPNNTTSYGFITRGCPRNCSFCFVPKTEGKIRFDTPIDKIINPKHNRVSFLDNNILAYEKHEDILNELIEIPIWCEFNQGLDIRLINEKNAYLLSKLKYIREYNFGLDDIDLLPIAEEKLETIRKYINPRRIKFYIYHNAETMNIGDAVERVEWCRKQNVLPYLMRDKNCWTSRYREFYNGLAAYCNQPNIFRKMPFETFIFDRVKDRIKVKNFVDLYTTSKNRFEWMSAAYDDALECHRKLSMGV
jgi:hypothetical protein